MVEFGRVDVKEVTSDVPRAKFSEERIQQLADSILESGGVVRPLVLKQLGIDRYALLDGHLEYYASVRAREIDPRRGEMVNAFIIASKEDEKGVIEQIQILGKTANPLPPEEINSLSHWITSFEQRLSELRETSFQNQRDYDYRLRQIEAMVGTKDRGDLLNALNTLEEQELVAELLKCGIESKKVEAIYAARQKKENHRFSSYQDLIKSTKGLGEKGFVRLLDYWKRIHS